MSQEAMPSQAEIVIIGGGIVGASLAYHLTKLGKRDVLLLEQGQLSGGTTWHAAGLVGQLRSQESMTRLIRASTELYAGLEAEIEVRQRLPRGEPREPQRSSYPPLLAPAHRSQSR